MSGQRRMIGRRDVLRAGGAFGLGAATGPLLAACGRRADVRRLVFLNWQDYVAPETVPDFERRTGIDVTYQTYASNDELARTRHPALRARRGGRGGSTFDLVVPSDNFVRSFRAEGILALLDRDRIEGLDNLRPEFRDPGYDPGNRYTIPWATGTTGIGYDTEVFSEPPGWDVFLDDAHKGRMTLLDEARDAFAAALFSLGRDPNSRSPADVDAGAARLREMKKTLRRFDSGSYLDDLARGRLVCAQAYSTDLLQARERNPRLAFTLPEAGATRWVDALAIPVDAPHKANAERFMSYYLTPEASAKVSEAVGVDTANAGALELLPRALRENETVFPPPDVLDRLVFVEYLGEKVEDRYAAAFQGVKGG